MISIAVEGINGSGKTPTLRKVQDLLAHDGVSSAQYAPYHLVRAKIDEEDIFPLWQSDPKRAVDALHSTIDEIEADARSHGVDVVLYDRHWLTAYTQAENNPVIKEWWGERFVPTFLFTSPSEHAGRLALRGYSAQWLQQDTIEYYRDLYNQLYGRHSERFIGSFTVSDSTQDLAPIARQMRAIITNLLAKEQ